MAAEVPKFEEEYYFLVIMGRSKKKKNKTELIFVGRFIFCSTFYLYNFYMYHCAYFTVNVRRFVRVFLYCFVKKGQRVLLLRG